MARSALLVEDSTLMTRMISIALNASEEYAIIQAEDSMEAITKLERGLIPSLVILDVCISDINKMSLVRKIREVSSCRDIPIIILASEYDSVEIKKEEIPGATCRLGKPFKVIELHETLKSLIH
ncbi:MAG: response regulator [Deltaproteobacteria bacterium]|nr:response regulator [Deltaproteobacteria bacterium]